MTLQECVAKSADCQLEDAVQLSAGAVASYRESGFIRAPAALGAAVVASLREAVADLRAGRRCRALDPIRSEICREASANAVWRINQAWWLHETIERLATSTFLGSVVSALIGEDGARLWGDVVIGKPPGAASSGGVVGWHQDAAYWNGLQRDNMCTAWVALQDTDENNGGLIYLDGSHRWGLLAGSRAFFEQNLDDLRDRLQRPGEVWRPVPMALRAGEITLHHGLCLHASGPNPGKNERVGIAIHFMPIGCRFTGGPEAHRILGAVRPDLVAGDILDGLDFPVVWPR
ncbi:phytanoyl-CoA dioxygenase family protein [Azospirillum agricola]|uniref:phytanoyl-CoA dioxygenase family protein n=1 Tax=Azospirillum agricola TaxID=1720247 RepID=UPI000A0F1DA7|nr:phytanoyl-CoA dioxygenase family protein [Azospirillum agricola]SMH28549.1 Ectoine hydroxylase-related dioxygenase, phytanoyl-CoA dioxygenase (PhyH) family [Azospirillum lipoferum]